MSQSAQIILDQVVLVKVDATIYGARKKLKKEDLLLADGSKLPPEDLASLGSKRLLDPEQLSVFNRLKKEAERICLRVGTRFLGGFIIPNVAASDIIDELERIGRDFTQAKADFLAGYDNAVQDWLVKHPEFASIIEQAVDSVEFVSTRLAFDYLVVAVMLPETLPEKDIQRLETKIESLSEQLFHEIAVDANQLIEQSLLGKDQVTRNALRPIKRIRDKLDGLGFLDYRVAPVVETIDTLLNRIPERGAITGGLLQEILAMAMLLADPDKTRRHGLGLLAQQDPLQMMDVDGETPVEDYSGGNEELATHKLESELFLTEKLTPYTGLTTITALFDGIFDEDDIESDSTVNQQFKSEELPNSEPVTTLDDADEQEDGTEANYWF